MTKTPAHNLGEVHDLVSARKVRWSATKAIDPLKEMFEADWKKNGYAILRTITDDDFHGTITQNNVDFDVYAVTFAGVGWYVKLSIETTQAEDGTYPEQVFSISCHPLDKPLKTKNGEVQP